MDQAVRHRGRPLPLGLTARTSRLSVATAPRFGLLASAPRNMVLAPGQEVLHYRLVEEIGRGGMGVVFRADDLRLRRSVAVKILHGDRVDDGDRKRLLREARLASAMSHAGVVTIHALESTNELDFIVMEHVDGMSLKAMIERGPLEPRVVARLGTRLADALDAAHRQGILHRDVKPSNVLVSKAGEAKLVDFGIARPMQKADATRTETLGEASSEAPASDLSTERGIVGTVSYMSPEQVRGEPLDARSDVFSLGATLYEALTGRRPFEGATPVWIGHAILHTDPVAPSSVRSGIPRQLDAVVARALAKSRDTRYGSARELADALTRVQTDIDMGRASAATSTEDFDPVALVPSLGSSGRTRVALAAAALVGVGAVAWGLTREPANGPAASEEHASAVAPRPAEPPRPDPGPKETASPTPSVVPDPPVSAFSPGTAPAGTRPPVDAASQRPAPRRPPTAPTTVPTSFGSGIF